MFWLWATVCVDVVIRCIQADTWHDSVTFTAAVTAVCRWLTRTRSAFRLIFHLSLNRKTDVLQPCTLGNKAAGNVCITYSQLTKFRMKYASDRCLTIKFQKPIMGYRQISFMQGRLTSLGELIKLLVRSTGKMPWLYFSLRQLSGCPLKHWPLYRVRAPMWLILLGIYWHARHFYQ